MFVILELLGMGFRELGYRCPGLENCTKLLDCSMLVVGSEFK
jgi:hypothetical protein